MEICDALGGLLLTPAERDRQAEIFPGLPAMLMKL
jgi:hypothetical protein